MSRVREIAHDVMIAAYDEIESHKDNLVHVMNIVVYTDADGRVNYVYNTTNALETLGVIEVARKDARIMIRGDEYYDEPGIS